MNLELWLTSQPDDRWGAFTTFGDGVGGDIWFEYIAKGPWPHSCYDTRLLALQGHEAAREHMTNYCAALVAANL